MRRWERPREERADKSLWSLAWRNRYRASCCNTSVQLTECSSSAHPFGGVWPFLDSFQDLFLGPSHPLSSICTLSLLLLLTSDCVQLPKAVSHLGRSSPDSPPASLPLPRLKLYHLMSQSFALYFHLGKNPCQDIKVIDLLWLFAF